jgi:hypothetical protein
MTPARFPHSDTPGSTLGCQLPRAYRRLLRPSSALDAKASTTCPSQLVTHTTNPTPTHPSHKQPEQNRNRTDSAHNTPQRTNTPRTINEACNKQRQPHPQTPTQRPLTEALHRDRQSCQMLASTIQISNNNPTPPTPNPQGHDEQPGPTEAPAPHTAAPVTGRSRAADSSEPQQRVCRPAPPRPRRTARAGEALGLFPRSKTAPAATTPHSPDKPGIPRQTRDTQTNQGFPDKPGIPRQTGAPVRPWRRTGVMDRCVCSLERR